MYPGADRLGTEIGLTEVGAVRETNDTAELGLFKPELRAAVAMPEGGSIPGQTALRHLDGWTVEEMAVRARWPCGCNSRRSAPYRRASP